MISPSLPLCLFLPHMDTHVHTLHSHLIFSLKKLTKNTRTFGSLTEEQQIPFQLVIISIPTPSAWVLTHTVAWSPVSPALCPHPAPAPLLQPQKHVCRLCFGRASLEQVCLVTQSVRLSWNRVLSLCISVLSSFPLTSSRHHWSVSQMRTLWAHSLLD